MYLDFGICELRIHRSIETELFAIVDETFLQIPFKLFQYHRQIIAQSIFHVFWWIELSTLLKRTKLFYRITVRTTHGIL